MHALHNITHRKGEETQLQRDSIVVSGKSKLPIGNKNHTGECGANRSLVGCFLNVARDIRVRLQQRLLLLQERAEFHLLFGKKNTKVKETCARGVSSRARALLLGVATAVLWTRSHLQNAFSSVYVSVYVFNFIHPRNCNYASSLLLSNGRSANANTRKRNFKCRLKLRLQIKTHVKSQDEVKHRETHPVTRSFSWSFLSVIGGSTTMGKSLGPRLGRGGEGSGRTRKKAQ